jgi:SAM-dependent methyltransferase
MLSAATLPLLTTKDYKEMYRSILTRYRGRENARACISKHLSQLVCSEQEGLRVLLIGPGTGDDELKLLAAHKVQHLTAVEPSPEMADGLEANLRSSSSFIKKWNIEQTNIESYLMDKTHSDGPFDIILMIHSVYYLSPRGNVLQQIRSLLRPHTGQLLAIITFGCYSTITRKYLPESKHGYDGDDLEHDLRVVNIPFERHLHNVTLNITDIKGDDQLQWSFASFFLARNVAYASNNLATEVIEDLVNMANRTNDGKLEINFREDVFVVRPIDYVYAF